MRAFIVVCLIAAAYAAPQGGYNYQQQQQHQQQPQSTLSTIGLPNISGINAYTPIQHNSATSTSTSSAYHTASIPHGHNFLQDALQNVKLMQTLLGGQNSYQQPLQLASKPTFLQQQQQQPQLQQQQQQFGFNYQAARPNFISSFGQQQLPQAQYQQHTYQQQPQQYHQQHQQQAYHQPTVTKDIYVHVAPEEQQEQQYQPIPQPVLPPRKHYRIVFIKAPTQNIKSTALSLKQAPTEEKTIIYVLTKKQDPLDIQAALQEAAPKPPSKPEVYFIKYKTQEEAQHAQRTIQAQYDQLGGTTQVSDEGIAPVTSVIGSLDHVQHQQNGGSIGTSSYSSGSSNSINSNNNNVISSSNSASSKYLPPIIRI